MTGGYIHHIVPAAEYRPGEPYLPVQYPQDGFIHCTTEPDLLLHIANAYYRTVLGEFLVLVIDPDRLTSELRYEPPVPAPTDGPLLGRLFPHIYGPLNPEAVVAVRTARREAGGVFLEL